MKSGLTMEQDGPSWNEKTCFDLYDEKYDSIDLPDGDLSSDKFDKENRATESVFIIFSTPRSGSTALCDFFKNSNVCIPHEYFQPFQYMPYLAKRWKAHKDGILVPKLYVDKLCEKRTANNGVLGINLHGSHLKIFEHFLPYFPKNINFRGLVLKRRDKIAQAVSYFIASESKVWSSHFGKRAVPIYSFEKIKSKLSSILTQEVLIDRYVALKEFPVDVLFYEDLCSSKETIELLYGPHSERVVIDLATASTKKQSNQVNDEYSQRFKYDLGL